MEDLSAAGAAAVDDAPDASEASSADTAEAKGGAALLSLALAACGGGGGNGGSAPSPPPTGAAPPPPPPPKPTAAEAARFLAQASTGATRVDVTKIANSSYSAWLEEQFATPRAGTLWDRLIEKGYADPQFRDGTAGWDPAIWRSLIASPDTLRQRVALALLDFLVVGIEGIDLSWRQFAMAAYVDVLMDEAFGNYRILLERMSTLAATASFLTFLGNRKANPQTGAVPDENYARELLQLFTVGLHMLEADGTVRMEAGRPIETYTQDDITGLARVFTGFQPDSSDNSTPDRWRRPLQINLNQHEGGEKRFLGTTVPAGTSGGEGLKLALNAIFAHPNVPPFVSTRLIQRLVTSNPSRAYVGRVSAVFANNGAGVRGDLRAVVRAILLDDEARSAGAAVNGSFGKLREPVLRLTGWARAFGATSAADSWNVGDTSAASTRLGQSPGRAPSVFGWFRPGYTPPASAVANAGLVAPEFQLTHEPSVVGYLNYMAGVVANGAGDLKANYADMLAKATDSAALAEEANLLLAAGALAPATVAAIRAAADSISATTANGPAQRVHTAVFLTLASPDYLVQK